MCVVGLTIIGIDCYCDIKHFYEHADFTKNINKCHLLLYLLSLDMFMCIDLCLQPALCFREYAELLFKMNLF